MTRAIASHCGSRPEVLVRSSAPDRPMQWEAKLLELPTRQRVLAREISLQIDGQPVLDARSITAVGSSIEARLSGLGNIPLAELLFADPLWQRIRGPLLLTGSSGRPGRVCIWRYHGRRPGNLLVAEYFLPALLAQPRMSGHRSAATQESQR